MTESSLFGFISTKLASSPENIATEALCFVLQKSQNARSRFVKYLKPLINPKSDIYFRTQVIGEKKEIPDLVGVDVENNEILIIESKFWAGLTSNQPVTYLQRLPKEEALLLFIAPSRRFPTLWPELQRRCIEASMRPEVVDTSVESLLACRINDTHYMAISSWKGLLEFIRMESEVAGDFSTTNDILQILGLSETMDQAAFLPIQSHELSSGNGSRYLDYLGLVDDSINLLKQEKVISTKGLRATPARGRYIRYFILPGFGCSLDFHPEYWGTIRETPIWLRIKKSLGDGSNWQYSDEARIKLQRLENESPSRLLRDGDTLLVPIFLPFGEERDSVLSEIVNQIKEVIFILQEACCLTNGLEGTPYSKTELLEELPNLS